MGLFKSGCTFFHSFNLWKKIATRLFQSQPSVEKHTIFQCQNFFAIFYNLGLGQKFILTWVLKLCVLWVKSLTKGHIINSEISFMDTRHTALTKSSDQVFCTPKVSIYVLILVISGIQIYRRKIQIRVLIFSSLGRHRDSKHLKSGSEWTISCRLGSFVYTKYWKKYDKKIQQ